VTSPVPGSVVTPATSAWADTFTQFSLFHAVCVAICAAAAVIVCLFARLLQRGPVANREPRFTSSLGGSMAAVAIAYTAYFLRPDRFSWQTSLPLQFCDLLVIAAPLSFLTSVRWIRTLVVFWGIGLSTQAFVSPIVNVGYTHTYFWLFWGSHLAIVMAATYHIAVYRYRAGVADLFTVTAAMCVYALVIIPLDIALEANYGFVGKSKPGAASIIDALGPWPLRLVWMFLIQQVLMVVLWLLLRERRHAEPASA
jgi:hypothetical integral membrane protein (TIGR02206 family)